MPRKKITTTEETIEEPKEDINYKDDIAGKTMSEVASDKEEIKPVEVEEKVEPIVEETKPEEPPFDPVKFKEETIKEATENASKALIEKLSPAQKEEVKDEYGEWASAFEKSNGEAPTWKEAAEFIKEKAKAELKAENEKAWKDYQDTQKEKEDLTKQAEQKFNQELTEELDELYLANKLPKIKDKENPNDPGIVATTALLKTMSDINTARVAEGKEPIRSVSRIFTNHFKAPSRQPAGADAMMIDSRASSTSANEDREIDYFKDIKGGFRGVKGWFRR